MINKTLVKQVQAGTHCIKYNKKSGNLKKLLELTKYILYDVTDVTFGFYVYYYIANGNWQISDTLPLGLTPISLDDFFKGEEERGHFINEDGYNAPVTVYKDLGRYPPPQSSGVQTINFDELTPKEGELLIRAKMYADEHYEKNNPDWLAGFVKAYSFLSKEPFSQKSNIKINDVLRSIYSIIERKGKDTNWEAIGEKVKYILENQQTLATPSLPPSEEKGVEDASQWFDNNSDCYAGVEVQEDFNDLNIPALTKDKFLEYIKSINNGK